MSEISLACTPNSRSWDTETGQSIRSRSTGTSVTTEDSDDLKTRAPKAPWVTGKKLKGARCAVLTCGGFFKISATSLGIATTYFYNNAYTQLLKRCSDELDAQPNDLEAPYELQNCTMDDYNERHILPRTFLGLTLIFISVSMCWKRMRPWLDSITILRERDAKHQDVYNITSRLTANNMGNIKDAKLDKKKSCIPSKLEPLNLTAFILGQIVVLMMVIGHEFYRYRESNAITIGCSNSPLDCRNYSDFTAQIILFWIIAGQMKAANFASHMKEDLYKQRADKLDARFEILHNALDKIKGHSTATKNEGVELPEISHSSASESDTPSSTDILFEGISENDRGSFLNLMGALNELAYKSDKDKRDSAEKQLADDDSDA